jgi:FkbM family methyltransferase
MNQIAPAAILDAPPLWLSLGIKLSRRLPRGRHRSRMWLVRRAKRPFVAEIPVSSKGLKFKCDLQNNFSLCVFIDKLHSNPETQLISHLVKPGMTFVDAGSHWGYFGLLASEQVGSTGRVIAIEAHPAIFNDLETNVRLNSLENMIPVHTALAASDGPITLSGFDEESHCFETSFVTDQESTGRETAVKSFQVPGRKLDSLLDEHGVGVVDFLKMDIEGAEAICLPTMAKSLAEGRYKLILIEVHPQYSDRYDSDVAQCIAPIREANYEGWGVLEPPNTNQSPDHAGPLSQLLQPLDPENLGNWRHQLWLAPGVSLDS